MNLPDRLDYVEVNVPDEENPDRTSYPEVFCPLDGWRYPASWDDLATDGDVDWDREHPAHDELARGAE